MAQALSRRDLTVRSAIRHPLPSPWPLVLFVTSSRCFAWVWTGAGFYPYFASSGFSYGSTPHHWPDMVSFGKSHGLLPVLSVGPGYNDEKIRPWNKENTKPRRGGHRTFRARGFVLSRGAVIVGREGAVDTWHFLPLHLIS